MTPAAAKSQISMVAGSAAVWMRFRRAQAAARTRSLGSSWPTLAVLAGSCGMLQVNEQVVDLGLHFLANGLAWLSVDGSKEGSRQRLLLQQLSALPKTYAVSLLLPAP